MEKNDRIQLAIIAAEAAGEILLDNFSKITSITAKGDRDFVTNVDIAVEKEVVRQIKEKYPSDCILSEEGSTGAESSDYRWIIDPLDGTHNYIHNIEIFGTSIAVEYKGEVVIGVIYMPVTKKMYTAQKGKGAFCNGANISVSKRNLKESTLIYDSSIRCNKKDMLKGLANLVDDVFNVRMFGSSACHLTYVAEGIAEIDLEFNDKVWDYAAGLLIIEEAGGKCTDFKGQKWTTDTKEYIATNGVVHDEVVKRIQEALKNT